MKKIYPPRHTVGIAISKKMNLRLKKIAKREQRSVSSIIRLAITNYLNMK